MATRSVFQFGYVCFLLASGCATNSTHTASSGLAREALNSAGSPSDGGGTRVGSHGMVVVGTPSRLLLSHIPMFHQPHDVQLILQARIEQSSALPTTFIDKLYTFVPDPLSLDDLRTGKLTTMKGTVYAGNFENGGTPLARVCVFVTGILHQHVLEANDKVPQPTYFAQGTLNEAVVIHRIAGAPGYDQVLVATLTGVSEAALAEGVVLYATTTVDALNTRLRTAQTLTLASAIPVVVTPRSELSCLVGPHFTKACE
jgi:hypothetical protein